MHARNLFRLAILAGAMAAPQMLLAQDEKPATKDPAKLFAELDKNGDGKLSTGEVSEAQRRHVEHLLRVAGKDKDGELTKEEFLKGFKPDDLKVAAPQNIGGPGGGNRPDPAQVFQRFDANKDGKLVLDEIPAAIRPRFQPIFDRLDKELTRDEFVLAAGRFGGGAPGGGYMADPEAYFKTLDANHDGKVTLEEVPEQSRPQLERWFARLKKDKTDSLTLDDLKTIVAQNQARDGRAAGAPGQRPSPIFRKLDANGDGKLTKEELQKGVELFEELDLNQDGFLDPGELFGAPAGAPGAPGDPAGGKNDRAEAQVPEIKGGNANRPVAAGSTQTPPGSAKPAGNGGRGIAAAGIGKGVGQRLDTDGDGKISRSEARGRLKQNFDTIDKNGDGFLDRDEIQSALQQATGK